MGFLFSLWLLSVIWLKGMYTFANLRRKIVSVFAFNARFCDVVWILLIIVVARHIYDLSDALDRISDPSVREAARISVLGIALGVGLLGTIIFGFYYWAFKNRNRSFSAYNIRVKELVGAVERSLKIKDTQYTKSRGIFRYRFITTNGQIVITRELLSVALYLEGRFQDVEPTFIDTVRREIPEVGNHSIANSSWIMRSVLSILAWIPAILCIWWLSTYEIAALVADRGAKETNDPVLRSNEEPSIAARPEIEHSATCTGSGVDKTGQKQQATINFKLQIPSRTPNWRLCGGKIVNGVDDKGAGLELSADGQVYFNRVYDFQGGLASGFAESIKCSIGARSIRLLEAEIVLVGARDETFFEWVFSENDSWQEKTVCGFKVTPQLASEENGFVALKVKCDAPSAQKEEPALWPQKLLRVQVVTVRDSIIQGIMDNESTWNNRVYRFVGTGGDFRCLQICVCCSIEQKKILISKCDIAIDDEANR